ncbi:hypothetical protein [Cupriavidus pauculus]|uniref:hypothetical protein n=1 Tax=Cupriavidus pauculus TaxID=82633 RepID=UPI0011AFCBA8|nr:hypothetical protein [Cupriavidus pauculus]
MKQQRAQLAPVVVWPTELWPPPLSPFGLDGQDNKRDDIPERCLKSKRVRRTRHVNIVVLRNCSSLPYDLSYTVRQLSSSTEMTGQIIINKNKSTRVIGNETRTFSMNGNAVRSIAGGQCTHELAASTGN